MSQIEERLLRIEQELDRLRVIEVPLYDSGGFVPTYTGSVSAGTTTYSTQWGAWIQIGDVVFATATVIWTNATGTGDARLSLPFTSVSTASQLYACIVRTSSVTFAAGAPTAQIDNNTSFMYMITESSNAASSTLQMEAAGVVVYTAIYFIA